jgi:hypothetical protein
MGTSLNSPYYHIIPTKKKHPAFPRGVGLGILYPVGCIKSGEGP